MALDVARAARARALRQPRRARADRRARREPRGGRAGAPRRPPGPRLHGRLDPDRRGAQPGTPGSGDDPLIVGLSLDLPVWRGSYAAGEREARHGERAARGALDARIAALGAELEDAAFAVDDARRRLALYEDSLLPRAREAFELTLAAYRTGGATLLDLFDAERAWFEFELSLWRAARDHELGRARLEALIGGSLE
ncbi:MAG: TolC family protein [Planctomycetes bacterium]|nr:TolC family protein [Planctomycetota bacterium]